MSYLGVDNSEELTHYGAGIAGTMTRYGMASRRASKKIESGEYSTNYKKIFD